MKPGREYETFLHETFAAFFPEFAVQQNDKIMGQQSGIRREIDISVRGEIEGVPLFYVVQAKDHKKPADIKILGEFSAVVRDVGASKGFLICSSGFAKTIRDYARTLGIELLTVEDIASERWKASVEIPLVVRTYELSYTYSVRVIASEALAEANKGTLEVDLSECLWSLNKGESFQSANDTITALLSTTGRDLDELSEEHVIHLRLDPALTMVTVAGCPCRIGEGHIELAMTRTAYLKMIVPSEYRHIRNHLRPAILPTKVGLNAEVNVRDGTWSLVDFDHLPVRPDSVVVQIDYKPEPLRATPHQRPKGNRAARRAARSSKRR